MKTPCGVTPPPPHFGARRFVIHFGKWRLQAYACRSFGGSCLILFDLGRSWQISSEPCLFLCRFKKTHLQTSVQRRCPKTTTNPVTILSKLRKIDPTSITNRPKIHQKSIGIDSGKRSVAEAQRGTTVKIHIEAFWPLGRCRPQIWTPLDFEGPIGSMFLDVFCVGQKQLKNISCYCVVCICALRRFFPKP